MMNKYTCLNKTDPDFCLFILIFSSDVNDFIFADNQIEHFDAEAFSLYTNGRIIIERNNFLRIDHAALSGMVDFVQLD